jgi:hypothetical protein
MFAVEVRRAAVADVNRGVPVADVAARIGASERAIEYWRAEAAGRSRSSGGKKGSGRVERTGRDRSHDRTHSRPSTGQGGAGKGEPGDAAADDFRHADAVDGVRAAGRWALDVLEDEGSTESLKLKASKTIDWVERRLAVIEIGERRDEVYDWDRLTTEELEAFARLRRKALVSG